MWSGLCSLRIHNCHMADLSFIYFYIGLLARHSFGQLRPKFPMYIPLAISLVFPFRLHNSNFFFKGKCSLVSVFGFLKIDLESCIKMQFVGFSSFVCACGECGELCYVANELGFFFFCAGSMTRRYVPNTKTKM